uniref:(northern house mosquito) hypothetical protein n=1 Tax=Culex pipiens TaxID=7175 RepID=A0A8D8J234_CULPI
MAVANASALSVGRSWPHPPSTMALNTSLYWFWSHCLWASSEDSATGFSGCTSIRISFRRSNSVKTSSNASKLGWIEAIRAQESLKLATISSSSAPFRGASRNWTARVFSCFVRCLLAACKLAAGTGEDDIFAQHTFSPNEESDGGFQRGEGRTF